METVQGAPLGQPTRTIQQDAIAQWHLGLEKPGAGWHRYPCGCWGVAVQCANLAHRDDTQ